MSDDKPVVGSITQLTQNVNLQDVDLTGYKPKTETEEKEDTGCGCGNKNCCGKHKSLTQLMAGFSTPPCNFESPCIDKGVCPHEVQQCSAKPRKCFRTVVDTITMWVYDRPGVEHQLGKMNNGIPTWWLAYEMWDSGSIDHSNEPRIKWIPWLDIGANRPCWEFKIRQGNYIKNKWNEESVNGTCMVDMICNGQKVYEIRCRDIEYAMAKAQCLMVDMMEHSFNFMNPQEEIGRRIWYHGQPAIIERLILDQGCIMIKYQGAGAGFDLSRPWDREDIDVSEWQGELSVKDDIFSPNIYWFRDEGVGEQDDNGMIEVTNHRGHKQVYPKALYEHVKYNVEWDFRNQFGIMRGGGDTVFFDKKHGTTPEKPFNMPLNKYDEELQKFHRTLVEKYYLKNG